MPDFLEWSQAQLSSADPGDVRGMVALTGVLAALAAVFKLGKRQDLLEHAPPLLEKLDACGFAKCPNTLLRKLSAKLVTRLGLVFLEPRLAPWRYQRGNRHLLSAQGGAAAAADTGGGGDEDDEYDIPEDIESVIELLLVGLRDKDTIVRQVPRPRAPALLCPAPLPPAKSPSVRSRALTGRPTCHCTAALPAFVHQVVGSKRGRPAHWPPAA